MHQEQLDVVNSILFCLLLNILSSPTTLFHRKWREVPEISLVDTHLKCRSALTSWNASGETGESRRDAARFPSGPDCFPNGSPQRDFMQVPATPTPTKFPVQPASSVPRSTVGRLSLIGCWAMTPFITTHWFASSFVFRLFPSSAHCELRQTLEAEPLR